MLTLVELARAPSFAPDERWVEIEKNILDALVATIEAGSVEWDSFDAQLQKVWRPWCKKNQKEGSWANVYGLFSAARQLSRRSASTTKPFYLSERQPKTELEEEQLL